MTRTKGKILWVILLTGLLTVTCDKEENIIPYVPVSFSVNLNVVNDLNVPGNSVYFAGPGFGGVIIYCELPGSYYAYDAACTHEISSACKVRNDGVLGTCTCCGSQYILMGGGYPSKGPATFPLQSYHVSVMSNILRIYN